ncbi:SIMPL domain-containing protein [Aestuariivirga sp.]|uniref:SIMPL domain-containing protein n=1 Tax=Aestuariivirga sp. TaxID=2650926 RepID=UPI00378423A3
MYRPTIAAAALGTLLSVVSPAQADDNRLPRTISLTGHGEVRIVPDLAFVNTGVTSRGATAQDALSANSRSMAKVMAVLKQTGIAEKDIQTSNFSVQPRYDYVNDQPPKLIGYEAANSVTATVRDIAGLGPLLDSLVSAGSNQIGGISFDVAEPETALDAARKLAAADATRKAKVYAEAMGLELGPVLTVSEVSGYQPPVAMMRSTAVMADAAQAPAIAAGEQRLSVDVNISWEIR